MTHRKLYVLKNYSKIFFQSNFRSKSMKHLKDFRKSIKSIIKTEIQTDKLIF